MEIVFDAEVIKAQLKQGKEITDDPTIQITLNLPIRDDQVPAALSRLMRQPVTVRIMPMQYSLDDHVPGVFASAGGR